jgi:hypothetical protein
MGEVKGGLLGTDSSGGRHGLMGGVGICVVCVFMETHCSVQRTLDGRGNGAQVTHGIAGGPTAWTWSSQCRMCFVFPDCVSGQALLKGQGLLSERASFYWPSVFHAIAFQNDVSEIRSWPLVCKCQRPVDGRVC